MALNLQECSLMGPALPEPFVRFELEKELQKAGILPKTTGADGKALQESWESYRRKLRELASTGGSIRVRNHVLEPLIARLGYDRLESGGEVQTREGSESGGDRFVTADDSASIRVWATAFEEDLDAPARRGSAYRYSHTRVAQRVLLACGERIGIVTNGIELRLLISDPARPDSQVIIAIDPAWKATREVPDSHRLLLALACPKGVAALPDIVEKARLQQARVTKELRVQARQAIEGFIQEVLDHPANADKLTGYTDRAKLANDLWHEGLITVYRLLFVLKLEANDDPARSFGFASTSLWRNTFSPSLALAPVSRKVLDNGAETGRLLEDGMRMLFRMFCEGIQCAELNVKPLGGALFGDAATPILTEMHWGEKAVAHLLDRLLWTPKKRGADARERVHYGPLDVEDLGRVYEALLELEPGITAEPMCRLRRQKLEVVVPLAQGEKYRTTVAADPLDDDDDAVEEEDTDDETPARGKKTKVEWIEEIPADRFFLRVGLGRKATGSYYTPHSFVRFLVQETLGPQVAERSSEDNPHPGEILKLKVLDPAMGSGHFLVEACRYLGEKLYEACRLCDERATAAERQVDAAKDDAEKKRLSTEAKEYRQRIVDLPDPDDEILQYLPSHAPEAEESGYSQKKAEALCRRLIAVHCLYGVDLNPLAVELAKLALWLESHSEGMPLTFLDHRLLVGNSLTGPFWDKLIFYPGTQQPIDNLFSQDIDRNLARSLREALRHVKRLDTSVGMTLAEMREKETARRDLERALAPFKVLAAAWAGGLMLGSDQCDDIAYGNLIKIIGTTGDLPESIHSEKLRAMIALGQGIEILPMDRESIYTLVCSGSLMPALPYDLSFPEVFYPNGEVHGRRGFDAIIGNPPWDKVRVEARAFLAASDPDMLESKQVSEKELVKKIDSLKSDVHAAYLKTNVEIEGLRRIWKAFASTDKDARSIIDSSGNWDAYRLFVLRATKLLERDGRIGIVISAGLAKNPADSALRKIVFGKRYGEWLVHFVNTKRLFESLPPVVEFCLFVSSGSRRDDTPTMLGFDLISYPAQDDKDFLTRMVSYPVDKVRDRVREEGIIVTATYSNTTSRLNSLEWMRNFGIEVQDELNRTTDGALFIEVDNIEDTRDPSVLPSLLTRGLITAYAGRNFAQYDDLPVEQNGRWSPITREAIDYTSSRSHLIRERCRYYRLAIRKTCGSPKTNKRSAIGIIIRPGCSAGNSVLLDGTPSTHPVSKSLICLSVLNKFVFDSFVRPHVQANINQSLLEIVPAPGLDGSAEALLAHSALRLTCNHIGYLNLWKEQVGDDWRENSPALTWPVFNRLDERWEIRAVIDATVAYGYGLDEADYKKALSDFDHRNYPKTPALCLAKFGELQSMGLELFARKYDPYWDIPLNDALPKPVIELPMPSSPPLGRQGVLGF